MINKKSDFFAAFGIKIYSLWKPSYLPLQSSNDKIEIKLLTIGTIEDITRKILKIHNITLISDRIGLPMRRLHWGVKTGVIIQFRSEGLVDTPKTNVLTIEVISAVDQNTFYNLYIQLYEHLGVILFDEISQSIIPPKEFKHFMKEQK